MKPQADLQQTSSKPTPPHTDKTYREAKYWRFYEVVDTVVEEIQNHTWQKTGKAKRRVANEQLQKLRASVEKLIRDCVAVVHQRQRKGEAVIHLNASWYSSPASPPELSYNIHILRAFKGMQELGFLEITKNGVYDRSGAKGRANRSRLTRFAATDRLVDLFTSQEQDVLPVVVPPAINHAPLRVHLKYDDELDRIFPVDEQIDGVLRMKRNLELINAVIETRWYDLRITQEEMAILQGRLANDSEGPKVLSLDRRSLYRVFNDEALTLGGRFYGGWWQNIPKEYRPRLLVNGKPMVEIDYSNMHPAILYASEGLLPPSDSYQGILDGEMEREGGQALRSLLKKSFNAMLNADKPLQTWPRGLSSGKFKISWREISQAILAAHTPIQRHFYTGVGRRLQRKDSDVAEQVMLEFIDLDVPILPIHDSFLVHWGHRSLLEKTMHKAIEDVFGITTGLGVLEADYSREVGKPSQFQNPGTDEFGEDACDDISVIIGSFEGYEKRQNAFWQLGSGRT